MTPLVSILIPCFNAKQWIAEAINSALAQTWPEKEVIVVDDGSTDGSLDVIQSFDGRIRWETGPNRGGNAARNRLLELARAELLQYLDADDYLLPEKIAPQMEFIRAHPELDVAFGPVTIEHWFESRGSTRTAVDSRASRSMGAIGGLELAADRRPTLAETSNLRCWRLEGRPAVLPGT